MTAIPRLALAPGLEISRLLTGLWQVADQERGGTPLDPDAAAAHLAAYAEAGLTTFDMADHYGSAELIAGAYRRRPGAPGAEMLTKWVPPPGPVTRDGVRAAVDRACDRLGVGRLPLLQFHAWTWDDPSWLDALFLLQELRDAGRIGALGLTNTDTAHLRMAVATGLPIVANQVCLSLLDRRATGRMAAFCAEAGVHLLAYGTLAGGFLSDRWLGAPEPDRDRLATWSQMKYGRFIRAAGGWEVLQGLLRAARRVADRHGASIATVATRWALDQAAVAGVIVGARLGERSHVAETVRVASLRLTDADHAELAAAGDALTPIPGDCGDEYRRPPYLTASGDLSHHVQAFPAPFATRTDDRGRIRAFSGTPWEPMAGYCRAVREGHRIWVSGTTATHGSRLIGGTDPAAQAHFCIDKIAGALRSLGGRLEDVVRTRVFVRDARQWEPVARAHGERFGHIQPANTLVEAKLVGDEYLVEIEADAVVRDGGA